MSIEYIVIIELITVLLVVLLVSFVLWRDKKEEVNNLNELHQVLLLQIEELQQHIEKQKINQKGVAEQYHDLEDDIDNQLDTALDKVDDNWGELERLTDDNTALLDAMKAELAQTKPDLSKLRKEVKELDHSLEKSERRVRVQVQELKTAKGNLKELKGKVRELSKRMLNMGKLEIREGRLQREKKRLTDRLNEMRSKYDNQKILTRNLEKELMTSFRASEVTALKDELASMEDELKRTLVEKQFIDNHFTELDQTQGGDEVIQKLERAQREITLLEQTVIDFDNENRKEKQ